MGRFALLFALAAIYGECADRVERVRRFLGNGKSFVNVASLWCFAAALVFPIGLAGGFAVLVYVHTFFRSRRHQSARPYRLAYTGATEILATMAAALVVTSVAPDVAASTLGVLAVVLALITYAVVNHVLIVAVAYLAARPERLGDVVPSLDDEVLEMGTLALAALLGFCLIQTPLLAPLCLLVIIPLRRASLVRELQQLATRDSKTGLLNAGAWREEAARDLARAARAQRPVSMFMVDLDHFKLLNDSLGHTAGDVALKAVADCLTDTLRGEDSVGRFGGEEFVVLLTETDADGALLVAERLCHAIRSLELSIGRTVTASIGVATSAEASEHDLDMLLLRADAALYTAKDAGRDRVRPWSRASAALAD